MPNQTPVLTVAERLEKTRSDLLIAGEADQLADLLSDHLYFAHSSGLIDGKSSFMEKYRLGTVVYRRVSARITTAMWLGDNALHATGELDMTVEIRGAPRTIQASYLVVWINEDGTWRLAAHQSTTKPS